MVVRDVESPEAQTAGSRESDTTEARRARGRCPEPPGLMLVAPWRHGISRRRQQLAGVFAFVAVLQSLIADACVAESSMRNLPRRGTAGDVTRDTGVAQNLP